MNLPVINVFSKPYEVWSTRTPTFEEMQNEKQNNGYDSFCINDKLIARVSNPLEAATYMATNSIDNGLKNFVDSQLDCDPNYRAFRQAMPSRTPKALSEFQQKYPSYSKEHVDQAINSIGCKLGEGQFLFHGGLWPNHLSNQIQLTSPFSTSFCPQVALRNAEWKAKAYEAGAIDLFVLRATSPSTNVFCFRKNGTKMGNEKEVLFASGATLRLRNRILIKSNYKAAKWDFPDKEIPIYVIEVEIS